MYYIYSDILYSQRKYEPKNIILDFKKLEEKKEFTIYEYPYQEIKADEQFYSIILLGEYDRNINFINVLLNYFYDVKKEDNFRLKLEIPVNKEIKKKKGFLKTVDLKHEKGNFKFYCFNFSVDVEFSSPEINEFGKVIDNDGQEVHIDIIVYNRITFDYADIFDNKIYLNKLEKVAMPLSESKLKEEFDGHSNYFFAGPNVLFSSFMRELRKWTVDSYGYYRPANACDRSRRELRNFIHYIIIFAIMIYYMQQKMVNSKNAHLINLWKE